MQVTVNVVEGRRFEVVARGVTTVVDDLVEDGGPGDGFRPTELMLGALGACTVGTMINFARSNDMDVQAVRVVLDATKVKAPTRVGSIVMRMEVEGDLTNDELDRLQRVASACTVHNTLRSSPEVTFEVVAK